ncbi:hypothetical protein BDZ89DRAFT_1157192 [Hymenopellis radicata]|nr:hypothetical protein BDZ89DRAFT_1157192 [Hymenopellis radicata]
MATTKSSLASHSLQRTDSETTDDSPFGSGLTTPVDEHLPPFENIHARLFAQLDLESSGPTSSDKLHNVAPLPQKDLSMSLAYRIETASSFGKEPSSTADRNASFADEIPLNCPPMERYSSTSPSGESPPISEEELELPSTPSIPAPEPKDQVQDEDYLSEEDLHIFPAELGVGTEFSISTSDDALLESSLMDSPTISYSLFSFTEHSSLRRPHDRSFSVTAVKDLDVANLDADDEASEAEDIQSKSKKSTLREITLFDTAQFFFDDVFVLRFLTLSQTDFVNLLPKALLFLPWYTLVGGVIVLFPQYLETVAFSTGYISSPPRGIRRYAHWADCALAHVLLFLLVVVMIGTRTPIVFPLLFGQATYSWMDFRFDERVPLGMDDRQSLYVVVKELVSDVQLRRSEGNFFVVGSDEAALDHESDVDES